MKNRVRFFAALLVMTGVFVYLVFPGFISSPNLKNENRQLTKIQKEQQHKVNYLPYASLNENKTSKENKEFKDEDFTNEKDKEYSSKGVKDFPSEREKRMEGFKSDRPDLFAQYERDIRTREGKTSPEYPMNYKNKTVNLTSSGI